MTREEFIQKCDELNVNKSQVEEHIQVVELCNLVSRFSLSNITNFEDEIYPMYSYEDFFDFGIKELNFNIDDGKETGKGTITGEYLIKDFSCFADIYTIQYQIGQIKKSNTVKTRINYTLNDFINRKSLGIKMLEELAIDKTRELLLALPYFSAVYIIQFKTAIYSAILGKVKGTGLQFEYYIDKEEKIYNFYLSEKYFLVYLPITDELFSCDNKEWVSDIYYKIVKKFYRKFQNMNGRFAKLIRKFQKKDNLVISAPLTKISWFSEALNEENDKSNLIYDIVNFINNKMPLTNIYELFTLTMFKMY